MSLTKKKKWKERCFGRERDAFAKSPWMVGADLGILNIKMWVWGFSPPGRSGSPLFSHRSASENT